MALEPNQRWDKVPADGPAGIGELAVRFGVTPRTLRFYEDQGLLTPIRERSQRIYGNRDQARLALICRGKRLGFTLTEIKDFLQLYEVGDGQLEQMRALIRRGRDRIVALERQLRDVEDTLQELRGVVVAAEDHVRSIGKG